MYNACVFILAFHTSSEGVLFIVRAGFALIASGRLTTLDLCGGVPEVEAEDPVRV